MTSTSLLVVGVDGLDFDVVSRLGPRRLPYLHGLVDRSRPHSSTFPPDSVPSWTSILTGLPPDEHGQLHSVNFFLEDDAPEIASLERHRERCFWSHAPKNARVAVINPFLANPPWPPADYGAMVSGPAFAEAPPTVADPHSLLLGSPPSR